MPLPLTICCSSKSRLVILPGFTFLVPGHLGSPRQSNHQSQLPASSSGPADLPSQTASISNQPFSTNHRTDRQTDRHGPGDKTCTNTHWRSINDSNVANDSLLMQTPQHSTQAADDWQCLLDIQSTSGVLYQAVKGCLQQPWCMVSDYLCSKNDATKLICTAAVVMARIWRTGFALASVTYIYSKHHMIMYVNAANVNTANFWLSYAGYKKYSKNNKNHGTAPVQVNPS